MKRFIAASGIAGLALIVATPAVASPNVFWTFGFGFPQMDGTTAGFAIAGPDSAVRSASLDIQALKPSMAAELAASTLAFNIDYPGATARALPRVGSHLMPVTYRAP